MSTAEQLILRNLVLTLRERASRAATGHGGFDQGYEAGSDGAADLLETALELLAVPKASGGVHA